MIFLISSVYTEIIATKTFSRNENIVPRKKLSEKIPPDDSLTIYEGIC